MQVFGIAGAAGSGKDTVYAQMERMLKDRGYRVTKLSFASKLKDVCCLLFGWDRERLEHDFDYKEGNTLDDGSPDPACEMLGMTRREVMQKIGTEAMRHGLHIDVWIIVLRLAIARGEYNDVDVGVLTDCRFLNEVNFVTGSDGKMVKVERIDEVGTLTDKTNHDSETEIRQFNDFDTVVHNNPSSSFPAASLDDLAKAVEAQVLKPFVAGYKTDEEIAEEHRRYVSENVQPFDVVAFKDYHGPDDFKRNNGI